MTFFSRDLVRESIDEVDGFIFKKHFSYSEKSKILYEDRYFSLLSYFPAIKKNSVGLEVGLAGGVLAILLRKVFNPQQLFALEHPVSINLYSSKFLKHIKKRGITLYPSDLNKLRFFKNTNSLDFISFCDVMEHLTPTYLPQIFAEFHRILKKNAYLIINTPNIASLLKRLNLLRGKNPIEFDLSFHEKATYGHIREYTLKEVRSIVEQAGFIIEKEVYFQMDAKRNIFTKLEYFSSKLIPSLANSIFIVARKK